MNYFAGLPGFSLRQGEHMRNAFKRLAKNLNTKFSNLEHYQTLCKKLFDTTPGTITQCKKLLTTKYVNIWDIVEGRYRYFEQYNKFRAYTRNGREFDRNAAKRLLLDAFLRSI
ncbi:hypothetical protein BGX24_001354 [Mortierella sp. AD032]|nr:hypothetical protein BGX24_001354 [Mortierella sp. AD032]